MGSSVSNLATKVDLKGKGIKSLEEDLKNPHMLPNFTKLQELSLAKNKIASIPASFAQDIIKAPLVAENLQILDVHKNRLTEVPEAIYLLIHLKELYLDDNEIVIINDKILNFYRLEKLSVSNNSLKRLPWGMNRLGALKYLNVTNNQLTYLPNPLGKCRSIYEMTVEPNPWAMEVYKKTQDLKLFMRLLRNQIVPNMYKEEARKDHLEETKKEEQISPAGRLMQQLLGYLEGVQLLEEQMNKELSIENLQFYKRVREFKKKYSALCEIRSTELVDEAKAIYDTYVADEAPKQVNLPAHAFEKCRKVFSDKLTYPQGVNQFIFDDAYQAAFDLMVNDTFQRFKLTTKGRELIDLFERKQKKKASRRAATF